MSYLLDKGTAQKAVEMVMPLILAAMESRVFKRRHLHIVVLDPAVTPNNDLPVLYENSIGDVSQWEHPYDQIARSKADLTWKWGIPTRELQLRMPHVLQPGDTLFGGSACVDGIVVGVSGVQPHFDEMIATMVAAACKALSTERRVIEIDSQNIDFIP